MDRIDTQIELSGFTFWPGGLTLGGLGYSGGVLDCFGDSLVPLWYTLDVSMGALGFLGCLLRGLVLLKVARNASRMHFGRRMKTCKN